MPDRPELMAIGDSIYNGTRSLTTNGQLAKLSVPAQVARAFGWDFKVPAYPFDVLFDLEALFRASAFDLNRLRASVIANAERWLATPSWADADCFDNLAIAQTTIAVSQFLAASEGEEERTQHEPYLVGVSVFVLLTVLLLATLSFNRNK